MKNFERKIQFSKLNQNFSTRCCCAKSDLLDLAFEFVEVEEIRIKSPTNEKPQKVPTIFHSPLRVIHKSKYKNFWCLQREKKIQRWNAKIDFDFCCVPEMKIELFPYQTSPFFLKRFVGKSAKVFWCIQMKCFSTRFIYVFILFSQNVAYGYGVKFVWILKKKKTVEYIKLLWQFDERRESISLDSLSKHHKIRNA